MAAARARRPSAQLAEGLSHGVLLIRVLAPVWAGRARASGRWKEPSKQTGGSCTPDRGTRNPRAGPSLVLCTQSPEEEKDPAPESPPAPHMRPWTLGPTPAVAPKGTHREDAGGTNRPPHPNTSRHASSSREQLLASLWLPPTFRGKAGPVGSQRRLHSHNSQGLWKHCRRVSLPAAAKGKGLLMRQPSTRSPGHHADARFSRL